MARVEVGSDLFEYLQAVRRNITILTFTTLTGDVKFISAGTILDIKSEIIKDNIVRSPHNAIVYTFLSMILGGASDADIMSTSFGHKSYLHDLRDGLWQWKSLSKDLNLHRSGSWDGASVLVSASAVGPMSTGIPKYLLSTQRTDYQKLCDLRFRGAELKGIPSTAIPGYLISSENLL